MSDLLHPDALAALRRREVRDERGLFLALGARFLVAAARAHAPLRGIAICPAMIPPSVRPLVRAQRMRGVPVAHLPVSAFRRVAGVAVSTGVALVAEQRWGTLARGRRGVWIGLDVIRSPGNLGTLLRAAAGAGAVGAIFLGGSADPYDAVAVRASMGALFSLRLVHADAGHVRAWAARDRARVLGFSARARRCFRAVSYRGSIVLMLGSERDGLSRRQRRLCRTLVRIPVDPAVGSLNVGTAAAVALYEAQRQRAP